MKTADKWRVGMRPLLLLALLAALVASSCRNNEVEVPPLTGPSGHRLFITIEAKPDHLVIHAPGRPRETSEITIQLKNQQGVGVAGQNVKLRIANINGAELSIGRLSDYNITTDTAGFGRVIYTAPDSSEQVAAAQIYVLAILTDPAYVNEVTDIHKLDLEFPGVNPGDCASLTGFTVAITAAPNPGHLNQPVCFTATPTGSSGGIAAVQWDFGDGTTATGLNVCHLYESASTFTVTVIVQDTNHNCATAQTVVTVDRGTPATCSIVVSPTPVGVNETVNFTAITTDPDGRVRRFSWSFGDGSSTSTSRNTTTHRYRNAGTFAVVLTITDDQGNISTCQSSVTVQSDPPFCAFTTNPDPATGNSPFLVQFDASGSTDDSSIATFAWDFGDGTSGNGVSPSHTFIATCTAPCVQPFNVTLTVTDDDGNATSCSSGVTVNNP